MLEFCSCDGKYKSKVGAVSTGERLIFRLTGTASNATMVMTKEGEGHVPVYYNMEKTEGGFSVALTITTKGLYFYHFIADGEYYGCNEMMELTLGGGEFLQLVYEGNFHPLSGGVIYQILPDRFCRGNKSLGEGVNWFATPRFLPDENGKYNTEFFGGDLKGIETKLDYLRSLGVTHIYLNPVFRSPSNHRYDTADYEAVDERLGGDEALLSLVRSAGEKGIGIILDGVFSHTGEDSKYFDKYGKYGGGAYGNRDSKYFAWYDFIEFPDKYKSWWGITSLPEVNETEPSYMEYMLGEGGIVDRWEKFGIVGWRLDVADELPDEFLEALRRRSKLTLIGEVWENAARKFAYGKRRGYFLGSELDGVTCYPVRQAIIDYVLGGDNTLLRRTVRELVSDYPQEAFLSTMNVLGTHDTVRILTALSDIELPPEKEARAEIRHDEKAIKRLKTASLIQFVLPGVPCIYYGDEAGLSGAEDPFCRRGYPWGRENGELIAHYAELGRMRKRCKSELEGETRELSPSKEVFVLERGNGLKLAVNLGKSDYLCEGKVVPSGQAVLFDGNETVMIV